MNGPVHHLHDVPGNGHAQASALDAAGGRVPFPLEGFKDMGDKLFAHADASVPDVELVGGVARRGAGLFRYPDADDTSGGGVFDGVAQQVQQNLVQPQPVAEYVLVDHVHGVHVQLQLLGMNVRLDDAPQAVENIRQGAGLFVQIYFAAFDAAHVQHIVDEAEQVVAGGHDFLEVLLHLFPVVDMGAGQGGKANDGVHGSPDVVGHVGEENALGLAGPVGLGQGVLQEILLLHLRPGFLIHAAETDDHAPAGYRFPDGDGLHLEIADLAHTDGPVVEIVNTPVFQFPDQRIPGEDLADHVLVVYIDAGLYVGLHVLVQGQLPGEELLQDASGTGIGPQGVSLAGLQVEIANQVIVRAQGPDQFLMAALFLELFLQLSLLLGGTVQEKALVEQLAVFLHELHIAHHVEEVPVVMPDPVFHADAVPHVNQGLDAAQQLLPVLLHHGGGDGVEAVLGEFLLGLIAQNGQSGPVDAENAGPVQAVAQNAAVHGGKEGFQGLVFPAQLLLIGPLLCHVNAHAHSAHDAAVQVVQGGLVGGQKPGSPASLNGLFRDASLPAFHDDPLGLNTGGIVMLHVPNISVPLSLDLLLGFVHRLAEAVVYFLMHAVLGLIPD